MSLAGLANEVAGASDAGWFYGLAFGGYALVGLPFGRYDCYRHAQRRGWNSHLFPGYNFFSRYDNSLAFYLVRQLVTVEVADGG